MTPLTPTHPADRRRWVMLLALLVLAVAVRWLAWQPFRDVVDLRGDESYYVRVAESIAAGEGHPGSFRPPLYPAAMAAVLHFSEGDLDAVRWAQIALSVLLVALVYDLGRLRFGEKAGLWAGAAAAVQPSLVHYSHFLWSELLAATLLTTTLWCLARWYDSGRRAWLAAAGLALGATALTKEIWVYFAAVVFLWIWWQQRRGQAALLPGGSRRAWVSALLFAVCTAAVVLPWTVRNSRLHDAPVLISTCRWFPIAIGNLLPEDDWLLGDGRGGDERREAPAGLDELEAETYWRGIALDAIRSEQPWWLPKKIARNTVRLFSVHSQTVRFLESGWIPGLPLTTGRWLLATDLDLYLLLLAAGIAGLWWMPDPPFKVLVVMAVLLTLGVHVLANAIPRFHVPILPLFCLYAGALAGRPSRALPGWQRLGGWLTLALFAAVIAIGWERSLGPALEMLRPQ